MDRIKLPEFMMTRSQLDAKGWESPYDVTHTPDGVRCRTFKYVSSANTKTGEREYRIFTYKIQGAS